MTQAIPQDLQLQNSWVCSLKGMKIPFNSTNGDAASVTNKDTWSDFDTAYNRVIIGDADGIGYVFHDTGIVGIDIDKGFDDDGIISDLAFDIISRCNSYTEYSRSGRGFHIFLKGNISFDGRNNGSGVEIYKNKRWFITTGNCLEDYRLLIENQDAIDYIVNTYFPEIERTNNDTKKSRYYEPIYEKPIGNTINIKPIYPPVKEGCRNQSLTSLAGHYHTLGMDHFKIYETLIEINKMICEPPLDDREIKSIVQSVSRYKRG